MEEGKDVYGSNPSMKWLNEDERFLFGLYCWNSRTIRRLVTRFPSWVGAGLLSRRVYVCGQIKGTGGNLGQLRLHRGTRSFVCFSTESIVNKDILEIENVVSQQRATPNAISDFPMSTFLV